MGDGSAQRVLAEAHAQSPEAARSAAGFRLGGVHPPQDLVPFSRPKSVLSI